LRRTALFSTEATLEVTRVLGRGMARFADANTMTYEATGFRREVAGDAPWPVDDVAMPATQPVVIDLATTEVAGAQRRSFRNDIGDLYVNLAPGASRIASPKSGT
jgi:hypothetical protein